MLRQGVLPVLPALVVFPFLSQNQRVRAVPVAAGLEIATEWAQRPQADAEALAVELMKNRQDEVILCRLRIGHTYGTHGHILRGEERVLCPCCHVPLTVSHIFHSSATWPDPVTFFCKAAHRVPHKL